MEHTNKLSYFDIHSVKCRECHSHIPSFTQKYVDWIYVLLFNQNILLIQAASATQLAPCLWCATKTVVTAHAKASIQGEHATNVKLATTTIPLAHVSYPCFRYFVLMLLFDFIFCFHYVLLELEGRSLRINYNNTYLFLKAPALILDIGFCCGL